MLATEVFLLKTTPESAKRMQGHKCWFKYKKHLKQDN